MDPAFPTDLMMTALEPTRQFTRIYKSWRAANHRAAEATTDSHQWRYYVDRCDKDGAVTQHGEYFKIVRRSKLNKDRNEPVQLPFAS